ncbi:ankyrin repeat domain-containing protein [Legionella norrlandica]|nr:ankyrin repeat domain-containing protein [Legionella norrlandica]
MKKSNTQNNIALDNIVSIKQLIEYPDQVMNWLKKEDMAQDIIVRGRYANGNNLLHAAIFAANRKKHAKTELCPVTEEHFNLIKYLLDNGADINAQESSKNFTPLMFSARFLLTDVFQLLLENGADPSLRSTETNPTTKELDARTVSDMMININDNIRKPIILQLINDHMNKNGLHQVSP